MKQDLVGPFVDAAATNPARANEMLRENPDLLSARWIHGETVLHFLAIEGYEEGVRFLAEAGAPVDATDEFGDTPLLSAALVGNSRIVSILIRAGANANVASRNWANALHAAASSGHADIVDLLLVAGARSDYRTDMDETIWTAVDAAPTNQALLEQVLSKHGLCRTTMECT